MTQAAAQAGSTVGQSEAGSTVSGTDSAPAKAKLPSIEDVVFELASKELNQPSVNSFAATRAWFEDQQAKRAPPGGAGVGGASKSTA